MRREIRRFRSYVSSIWSSPMELPELFLSAPISGSKMETIFRYPTRRRERLLAERFLFFSNYLEEGGGICAMCDHGSNPVHWSGSARRLLRLSFRPDLFFVSRPNWANRAGLLSLFEPASFLLFQFGRPRV